MPKLAAQATVGMGFLGNAVHWLGLQGGPWTVIRMRNSTFDYQTKVKNFLGAVDHVVAVCEWVKNVLLLNGVCREKLSVCRQGIEISKKRKQRDYPLYPNHESKLKMVLLGRADPAKGFLEFLRSVVAAKDLPIFVELFCIPESGNETPYFAEIAALATKDHRIKISPPIRPESVIDTLSEFDLLIVPSTGLETGPLVVLEAFAAGIPVIGSRIGGIAELITHNVNGMLCDPADFRQWTDVINNLCQDPSQLTRLFGNIGDPRQMEEVAQDMKELYFKFLDENHLQNIKLID